MICICIGTSCIGVYAATSEYMTLTGSYGDYGTSQVKVYAHVKNNTKSSQYIKTEVKEYSYNTGKLLGTTTEKGTLQAGNTTNVSRIIYKTNRKAKATATTYENSAESNVLEKLNISIYSKE